MLVQMGQLPGFFIFNSIHRLHDHHHDVPPEPVQFIHQSFVVLLPDKRDILRLSDTLSCGDCPGVQCAGLMAVRRIKDYEFMMNHNEELDRVEEQDTG